ncbi:signal peptidase II [Nannocystis pusilla]|uniref:Lipoprotein signal peptidase n=1 Tax=Nannocystis pusilla TaxID=889268 RepID=A0ABS7TL95_9BACT|nr:signal peptidase II [Nannocystis pusilla]MBZ5708996.1 signal peptidase II [Nannocystis pusilla]
MSDTPASKSARLRPILVTASAAAVFLILDLVTKSWAWENLRPPHKSIAAIGNWFHWSYSFNTGSAFGFLRGQDFSRPIFIVVTLITVVYMAALVRKLPTDRLYGFFAIGCIIGGALGNMHDRLLRQDTDALGQLHHGVVDFIRVCAPWNRGLCWPNFNVADIALVVGVLLLIPYLMFHAQPPETKEDSQEAKAAV